MFRALDRRVQLVLGCTLFLLFLLTFTVYLRGVSPSVYGGDSGDIILAGWFFGVAHPPGYPLNTLVGFIFGHLPYSAPVAFKVNTAAAFLMAATVVMYFLIANRLTRNVYVSLAASLILAFNPLFWLYAHIIEVFQLNLLLVSASVYFLLGWPKLGVSKRAGIRPLYISFLFLGLAVFHHHTSALLIPAYIYFVLSWRKKEVLNKHAVVNMLVFFLAGIVPYALLPIASNSSSPVNWDRIDSLSSFFRLITRADYGTFVAIGNLLGADFKERFLQILNLGLFLKADFGFLVFFVLSGAVYSYRVAKQVFWFLLISFLTTGPFFLFYSSFPTVNNFYSGLWERFILVTYFFVALYLAFGLLFYYNLLVKFFEGISGNKKLSGFYKTVFVIFLFVLPLYLYRNNYVKADLSDFRLGDYVGFDVLISAEPGSIIFLLGDTVGFNTEYIYYTGESLGDRAIIRAGSLNRLPYREQIKINFPDLSYPENFLSARRDLNYFQLLVEENFGKVPIYVAESVKGMEEKYVLTNLGLLKKLMGKDEYEKYKEAEIVNSINTAFSKLRYLSEEDTLAYTNFIVDHIREIYYRSFLDAAFELKDAGHLDEAVSYVSRGIDILPDNAAGWRAKGEVLFEMKACDAALENLLTAHRIDQRDLATVELIAKIYNECLGDNDRAEFYLNIARDLKKLRGLSF